MNNSKLTDFIIIKRDNSRQKFDKFKIYNAIEKAFKANGKALRNGELENLTDNVVQEMISLRKKTFHVEEIQGLVEKVLINAGHIDIAESYIIYKKKREEIRKKQAPEEYRKMIEEDMKYFDNDPYRYLIFLRTYARYDEKKGRRELWVETVDRYMNFMKKKLGNKLTKEEYEKLREAILWQKVLPSMRLLWSAGKAAEYDNLTAYNCAYTTITKLKDFAEILYILMCGAGVGFSVEKDLVNKLPTIKKQKKDKKVIKHVIEDSREGWAKALEIGLEAWFNGDDVEFDYSKIRPAGTPLKTMGGRASGPEPLKNLLEWLRNKILSKQGQKLSPLDVHDICCRIGEVVVVGGVRRTAEISLSSLDDEEIRDAKKGAFYVEFPWRAMANNSAVYEGKPDPEIFIREFLSLIESRSGERGIFNRKAAIETSPKRRRKFLKNVKVGLNPCGEINLKPKQLCNLSVIVVRPEDTLETLIEKARLATILGTYQAMLTDFKFISEEWKKNCEEERLLGVSITGYWSNDIVRKPEVLQKLKEVIIQTNEEYAKKFGINPATACTAVKPSGNTGELTNTPNGLHPAYAKYYIRRIRLNSTDPLCKFLVDQKVPYTIEISSDGVSETYIFSFFRKSPEGTITRHDLSAIQQLEEWKKIKLNYTEHNPSATVYVKKHEWVDVLCWVYKNFDIINGISFLPSEDYEHIYQNAPFEEISEEEYKENPTIDFSKLIFYENEDNTLGAKEYACVANSCELR